MSRDLKTLAAAAIFGTVIWAAKRLSDQRAQGNDVVVKRTTTGGGTSGAQLAAYSDVADTLLDAFEGLIGATPRPRTVAEAQTVTRTTTRSPATSSGGLTALLDMIGHHESGGDYNRIWGGISRSDYPPRAITTMTLGQVLDWQDSIDHKYQSEACGKYQFLEDTLRDLVIQGHALPSDVFNKATQDRLAIALMQRRGLDNYRSGRIDASAFAQELSKEWASLPAITRDKRGRVATGQSYYAGDGLNRALTSQADVLARVRAI